MGTEQSRIAAHFRSADWSWWDFERRLCSNHRPQLKSESVKSDYRFRLLLSTIMMDTNPDVISVLA